MRDKVNEEWQGSIMDSHTEYINIQALKDENDRLKKVIQRYEVMIEQYSNLTDEYKELIK